MTTLHCPALDSTPASRAPRGNRRRCDCARSRSLRERGSAIILVIVSIVLMAVLGATFVQVARFERISTGGEHIDIAIDSILNEVAVELARDLYDDNGNFFNPAGSVGDATNPGGGDEPYDYPWTNDTIPGQRPVVFVDGTAGVAEGGANDDTWLASTAVDNTGDWLHVSDLTGRFLNYANKDFSTGNYVTNPDGNPAEVAATAAMVTGLNVTADDVRLVDADGDGIGDSLWAYAPAAEIAGKRYVYAIRIVDLSARVNVNTALGQTDGGGNIVANPHGDSPTEIDGTATAYVFAPAAGVAQGTAVTEYNQTIARRYGGAATVPVAWGDATNERRHFWLYGASQVTAGLINAGTDASYDPADLYGQGDLFELLYKHGLNNPGVTPDIENQMPNLLRSGAASEFAFNDTPMGMGNSAYVYMRDNARNHFTTYSGVMAISPPTGTAATLLGPDHNGDGTGERVLQTDINHASVTEMAAVIAETLAVNGTFDATNFGHLASFNELGDQLAVNIVDMRDPDNRLTSHNGQFGMEALPFLAEVYVQREYGIPPAGVLNGDGVTYTMSYQAASLSDFAIEIRNPFQRPIDLEGVHLFVGGASWGELSALPGAPASNELGVGEVMLIFANNAAGEQVELGVRATYLIDLTGDRVRLWPNPRGPAVQDVAVELRAEDQAAAGTALTWGYSRIDSSAPPANYTESMAAASKPFELRPFMEVSDQGTGQGLDMLQCRPTDVVETVTEPSEARGSGASPALGNPTKAYTPTNSWDTGDQQWLFLDKETSPTDTDGRIPYVADVLVIPVVGPNDSGAPDVTLADAIGQSVATRLDGFMIDYRRTTGTPVPTISGTIPSLNVPHAVLLMERLTTHSPAVDGEDLDGDGVDTAVGGAPDYDEVFVPGKLNLNTASRDLLAAALPFPSGAQRAAVADRIIAFRDTPGGRPAASSRSTTLPGVAYTGELYEPLATDLSGLNPQPDWNDHQVGGSTSGNVFVADGITGDREEDLMLAKWLNEVCSTRSDVFAVYMVVQGYPAGNFGAGAVESARVVAVFSRANVRQVGDKARLIAVRRVE